MSNPRFQPNRRSYFLKGGQAKLDANKDGKISAEDFKLLKSKKKKMNMKTVKKDTPRAKAMGMA